MTSARRHALLAIVLCSLAMLPASAQLSNATIKGTVLDPSGAVITQAKLELTNLGTAEKRQGDSDLQGSYAFSALPPGEYQVKATAPGFAEWTGQLTLRVAQEAVIAINMKTASVTTTMEVADVNPVITSGKLVVVGREGSCAHRNPAAAVAELSDHSELHTRCGREQLRGPGTRLHPGQRHPRRFHGLPGGWRERGGAIYE